MSRKVLVTHSGPLCEEGGEVGWEDIYLSVDGFDHKLCPCFISYEDLLSNIEFMSGCVNDTNLSSLAEGYQKELDQLFKAKEEIDGGSIYVDGELVSPETPGDDFVYAIVYTPRAWIDKDEANRMIEAYLSKLEFSDLEIEWKTPEFVVPPVTIPRKGN